MGKVVLRGRQLFCTFLMETFEREEETEEKQDFVRSVGIEFLRETKLGFCAFYLARGKACARQKYHVIVSRFTNTPCPTTPPVAARLNYFDFEKPSRVEKSVQEFGSLALGSRVEYATVCGSALVIPWGPKNPSVLDTRARFSGAGREKSIDEAS